MSNKWEKEFIENYCAQESGDWIRFKQIRVNEALNFINDLLHEVKDKARLEVIEELIKMFREYKEKYPDAKWEDWIGLLAGSKFNL